ncbi:phosphate transport system substrate-binding protein [Pseudoduganella flava]|uniref:Phosphate ABC transporter substrate-binding protein n=1 Tax=Pseudoduganella flava TaxID=871742 RepID=A0A562PQG3_9BURK|nr:phosphate ABC transporter substrate-binding protein [Pseudoduganella flava]QGZ37857.1 phosphate ABC transporter substrate-binding protein [Pseudoduganella flava]TWI46687.1 phosphate transport system substrate-binding protein [Pseudoduganella flava]
MRPVRLVVVAALALLALCVPLLVQRSFSAAAPAQRLVIEGSTTMAPLIAAVARRFRQRHPEVTIEIVPTGSAAGIAAVRQGRATIGMVSRSLNDDERDLYGLPIARDGVAIVVHRANPVTRLTHAQLAAVFGGSATDWRQVGGDAGPVHVVAGPTGAGSTGLFGAYLGLAGGIRSADLRPTNSGRLGIVAKDPAAIAYVSMGEAERAITAGAPLRLLPVEDIWANSKNVRSGDYPISRPLMLVSRGAPSGAARAFFNFCGPAQIDDVVAAFEFVPYLD